MSLWKATVINSFHSYVTLEKGMTVEYATSSTTYGQGSKEGRDAIISAFKGKYGINLDSDLAGHDSFIKVELIQP